MREAVKRFVLGRPKLRQSWNKYNLYNISRYTGAIRTNQATFFQQKWAAKAMTRTYHGDNVPERRWTRLFSRRLASVVEMPPEYLAAHDGSEQAEGRGSGKQLDPADHMASELTADSYSATERARQKVMAREHDKDDTWQSNLRPGPRSVRTLMRRPVEDMTPYMQMAFAPLERRLEVAMFRAMFASSPRQARQFCVHGAVRVNGKKMRYGSYMLNPGDMFEVDPDKVMYATGKDKNQATLEAAVGRVQAKNAARALADEEAAVKLETGEAAGEDDAPAAAAPAAAEEEEQAPEEPALASIPEAEREAEQRRRLKALVASAKDILRDSPDLDAKRKRELRAFARASKSALGLKEDLAGDTLMESLTSHLSRFKLDDGGDGLSPADASAAAAAQPEAQAKTGTLSGSEVKSLASLLRATQKDDENPVDPSKPYATPWEPRKYLAPFTFIPRYLEVNQSICAAVYLRHPVARRGLAEVPTPFNYDVNQLAYTWYLRRR